MVIGYRAGAADPFGVSPLLRPGTLPSNAGNSGVRVQGVRQRANCGHSVLRSIAVVDSCLSAKSRLLYQCG
jgi:hypothetical protein